MSAHRIDWSPTRPGLRVNGCRRFRRTAKAMTTALLIRLTIHCEIRLKPRWTKSWRFIKETALSKLTQPKAPITRTPWALTYCKPQGRAGQAKR